MSVTSFRDEDTPGNSDAGAGQSRPCWASPQRMGSSISAPNAASQGCIAFIGLTLVRSYAMLTKYTATGLRQEREGSNP
jgi:hypothetical protein